MVGWTICQSDGVFELAVLRNSWCVCFVLQVSLMLSGGPRWLMDMMWVSAEDGKSNCAVYSRGENLFFGSINVFVILFRLLCLRECVLEWGVEDPMKWQDNTTDNN